MAKEVPVSGGEEVFYPEDETDARRTLKESMVEKGFYGGLWKFRQSTSKNSINEIHEKIDRTFFSISI